MHRISMHRSLSIVNWLDKKAHGEQIAIAAI
jgi:hypothetical protein